MTNKPEIDNRLIRFIRKRHILTLATTKNDNPWVCSCFYAVRTDKLRFIIASNDDTRHISEVSENKNIAANILLDTQIVGKIQGLQMSGTIGRITEENYQEEKKIYYKRFPYARAMNSPLWVIIPNYLKYTDNTLGFGKKLIYEL